MAKHPPLQGVSAIKAVERWDEILCHEFSQICRDAAYDRRDAANEVEDHVAGCMAVGGECHTDALRAQFPEAAEEA